MFTILSDVVYALKICQIDNASQFDRLTEKISIAETEIIANNLFSYIGFTKKIAGPFWASSPEARLFFS